MSTAAAVPPELLDLFREGLQDGVRLVSAAPDTDPEQLTDVEFLVLDHESGLHLMPLLDEMKSLRVVQLLVAGTDWVSAAAPDGVLVCRPVAARDNAVAEWVGSALLGLASGLLQAVGDQHRQRWNRLPSREFRGRRVVVVGQGPIGRSSATMLEQLGAVVTRVARTSRPGVHPVERLTDLLGDVDALVLLVPATRDTAGMVNAEVLAALPSGAAVINASRGTIVDMAALTAELHSGRLLAVLDVTDPEPLPPSHPLWHMPGCFISPHIAGATVESRVRAAECAVAQLGRYARGEELQGRVDP
jgi:phosphoglycerate dehydrogenase-like enzyme